MGTLSHTGVVTSIEKTMKHIISTVKCGIFDDLEREYKMSGEKDT